MTGERARIFESHRCLLEGLAYRMLGTLADAEDVVQDTWLRWKRADLDDVKNARTWLVTVCTRLAMDLMKSARARRERYVGAWLPEPLVDDKSASPADQLQMDDTVSLALMVALEKLSPAERAAFLLHEVFGYDFEEIGSMLERTPATCRKLASRARAGVREGGPRFHATAAAHRELLDAFLRAARAGELEILKSVLAAAVELHADGGGKAVTASKVMRGSVSVARFFARTWAAKAKAQTRINIVTRWFNGTPGMLIYEDGQLATALSVAVHGGKIHRIYAHRNPEKLTGFKHVRAVVPG